MTGHGTRSVISSPTARERSVWTTARYSCPTTAIRSNARCSASTDQQTIDIYVEDNFGQVVQLTFDFNNENEEKEEVQV